METRVVELNGTRFGRVRLRLRVARQRLKLDAALAAGADPSTDPALSLRACQLGAATTRRATANAISNVLDAAEEPPRGWARDGARPPLRRDDIFAARDLLLALIARLRAPQAAEPAALAVASLLVWDSASPFYSAHTGQTVADVVETILDLLDEAVQPV